MVNWWSGAPSAPVVEWIDLVVQTLRDRASCGLEDLGHLRRGGLPPRDLPLCDGLHESLSGLGEFRLQLSKLGALELSSAQAGAPANLALERGEHAPLLSERQPPDRRSDRKVLRVPLDSRLIPRVSGTALIPARNDDPCSRDHRAVREVHPVPHRGSAKDPSRSIGNRDLDEPTSREYEHGPWRLNDPGVGRILRSLVGEPRPLPRVALE